LDLYHLIFVKSYEKNNFYFWDVFFLSCSQNKFYLEIERLNNGKLYKRNISLINLKNHNRFFKNSNELVYYRSSYINMYNGKFKTFHVIYDVKNNNTFLSWFENKKEIFKPRQKSVVRFNFYEEY